MARSRPHEPTPDSVTGRLRIHGAAPPGMLSRPVGRAATIGSCAYPRCPEDRMAPYRRLFAALSLVALTACNRTAPPAGAPAAAVSDKPALAQPLAPSCNIESSQ